MTVITVLLAAWSFTAPPLLTWVIRRAHRLPAACTGFYSLWAFGAAGGLAGSLIGGDQPDAAAYGASSLLALVLWWHSRRKRRKIAKRTGEKGRAVLARMTRNMPRVPSRLVPQGARG